MFHARLRLGLNAVCCYVNVNKIIKISSIHLLFKLKEIKSLDSDMQTLVYENYNKFISATDTIRKVCDHMQNLRFLLTVLLQCVYHSVVEMP